MLINRITPVVLAIFVVICLLVSNTTGIPLGRPRSSSLHLMTNNSNNDSWLALTSQGVREPILGRSMPTSQPIYSNNPNVENKNVIDNDTDARQIVNQIDPNKYQITQETRLKWSSHLPLPYHDQYNKLKNSSRSLLLSLLKIKRHVGLSDNPIIADSYGNKPNPVNLPTSSPSRNSQRHRRNIEDTPILHNLDLLSDQFWIQNRCSNGRIELMDGEFKALPIADQRTHYMLVPYNISGQIVHGILAIRDSEKQYMCFNPSTDTVHPKGCFEPTNCAFKRSPNSLNFYEFGMVNEPYYKLSFNKFGFQIPFDQTHNSDYTQKSKLKCRQFEVGTVLNLDWENTGKKIFQKDIQEDPSRIRILEHSVRKIPSLCQPDLLNMNAMIPKRTYKRPNSIYKKKRNVRKKLLAKNKLLNNSNCGHCTKNSKSSTRSKHKVRHIKSKFRAVSS